METVLCCYTPENGWNPPLPALDSPQTLVLVFGHADWQTHKAAFIQLKHDYPQSIIAGCSGRGQIMKDRLHDEALIVAISRFASTQISMTINSLETPEDSWRVGYRLAGDLDTPQLSALLVFSDGFTTNGTDLLNGMYAALGRILPIAGGLAGAHLNYPSTWVLQNGLPQEKIACCIALSGKQLQFLSQAQHGWRPFGPQRAITRSKGNVLYELDHRPVVDLYKAYLGDQNEPIEIACLKFSLAIQENGSQEPVIRTPLTVNEDDQTIIFAGDVPTDSKAQLVYGGLDNLLEGADEAANRLAKRIPSLPPESFLLLAISCGARRIIMAEDTEAELSTTLEAFPEQTRQVGFYSYGELCPRSETGASALHNQTITLTVIYER